MCEELSSLRSAMRRYAARFDAGVLSTSDASKATEELSAICSIAQALAALAASRAAEAGTWRSKGHRSAAEGLAIQTGTSVSSARRLLETGSRICEQPEVAAAALRGELSFDQVSLVTDAVADDPSSERRLIEAARRSSVGELRDEVARTKATSADLEERRRRIHLRRSLRTWSDTEGMWHLHACGNPEDGARIMAGISPIQDQVFKEARRQDRREPLCAYGFDALLRMAEGSLSPRRGTGGCERGPEVKLLVRIDYDTFLRGVAGEGETCELVGYGQVAVSVVRELIEGGNPFVAAILTKGRALVGVAHLGRKPNSYQDSALRWLYPTCVVEGCSQQARLEADHTVDWAKTHFTMLDFLDLKCSHHHSMKTRDGWDLAEGTGKRPMVPPGDERHPGHKKKPA